MAKSSAALIVVYVLLVLFLVVSISYAYVTWRNYRRAMTEALQRRRDRDLERGGRGRVSHEDNYWQRDRPPAPAPAVEVSAEEQYAAFFAAAAGVRPAAASSRVPVSPHFVATPVYSPSAKPLTSSTATPGRR